MDWNAIVLRFIDGPGLGFTAIVLGFFAFIVALALIGVDKRRKSEEEHQAERIRAQDHELMKSQLARLVDETKETQKQLAERRPVGRPRKSAVIEAETVK